MCTYLKLLEKNHHLQNAGVFIWLFQYFVFINDNSSADKCCTGKEETMRDHLLLLQNEKRGKKLKQC